MNCYESYYLVSRIFNRLEFWKIDFKEIGADNLNGEWRELRRWGGNCNCWGTLLPEDETNFWYAEHAFRCLTEKETRTFESLLGSIILKEGKRFKKEKEEEWERIEQKRKELNSSYEVEEELIMNCRNKQDLKEEKEKLLGYLERFKKTNKLSEEEIKKEKERIRQEQQQKAQAEKAKSKQQEEDLKQKEKEFKNQVEEERKQESNQPTTPENKNSNDEPTKQNNPVNANNPSTSEDKSQSSDNQSQEQEEQSKKEELSSEILSKFSSLPNFNTKEKVENLINPVKDNPDFLLKIQTKHKSEDLNTLLTNKTPKEIIIAIKRFDYDKDKDKKIREYYKLKPNGTLTDKQINEYLYLETTNQLQGVKEQGSDKSKDNKTDEKEWVVPIVIGGIVLVAMICLGAIWKIKRKKAK